MKTLLLLLLCFQVFAQDDVRYKQQMRSLIDWQKLDVKDWMDEESWKEERSFRDSYPLWERLQRIQRLSEVVGRVMACFGDCSVNVGNGQNKVTYRSTIYEKDEVVTGKDSYLYLFLFDGTLVRLSPESSVSIKEINILKDRIFIHARVNVGNVLWLHRSQSQFAGSEGRETDTLFFPIEPFEYNPLVKRQAKTIEDYLFGKEQPVSPQYERLNKYIEKNNKWIKGKPTYSFIVTPAVSLYGKNLSAELYTEIYQDNYFKIRSNAQLGLVDHDQRGVVANLRGYKNEEKLKVDEDIWYKVAMPARELTVAQDKTVFYINEVLTKRIPSIFLVREAFLERYSQFLFEDIKRERLASLSGYRLWSESELNERLAFLWNTIRRQETSNIAVAQRYREKILEKSDVKEKSVVRADFYQYAWDNYVSSGEKRKENFFEPKLNSEKKFLWKKINGIRQ